MIITNEHQATLRNLISQYARRMTIEQRLAEIIRAFCADALSSTVNLNVDLDIMLCVLAQALLAAFRTRLGPGYAAATPDTLQRRFLDSPGTITSPATHHRPNRPPRLLTRPAPSQPPARHHRPLVARPPPALRVQLTQGRRSCVEIGVSRGGADRQAVRTGCAVPPWAAAGLRGPALWLIIPDGDVLPWVSPRVVTMPIQSQGIITRDNVSVDVADGRVGCRGHAVGTQDIQAGRP